MKHLKLFFALLAMLALGVGNAWGEEVTYVFTSKDWAAKIGSTVANWTSNKDGAGFSNNGIQVTTKASGANGTSPISYNNISQIVVTYNTNTSKGKGTLDVKIGDNAATTNDWQYSGTENGTSANFTSTFDYPSPQSGKVTLTANTTTNSIYVVSIKIITSAGGETPGEGGGSTEPAPCSAPTVAWDTKPANGEVDGSMTATVTTNYSNGLTYSSSNQTVATVTNAGVINYLSAGTTTITATVTGDGTTICEGPVSVQQEITVTAAAGGGGGGTLSYTWDLSTNSYSAATTEQVTWSSTDVDMIVEKGAAETAANSYLGGDANHTSSRFYPKSSLKIISTFVVTITSVVFTATTEADATALQNSSWTNSDATASGTTVTVTLNDPIVGIAATIGGTCDFTGVTVYYTKGDPEPEPEKIVTSLVWSQTEYAVTMGETPTFPTLTTTPADLTGVTYSSSNGAVATIAEDGTITIKAAGETIIKASYAGNETYAAATDATYKLTVKPAPLEPIEGGVIDILNQEWTDVTGNSYTEVAAKTAENEGHSNAQYVAQCAGDKSSIQLRSSNSNSGIVSTVLGGLVKRIEIEWNDATSAERTLNIYGSNTPYTNPTDLYDTNKDGDKLGTIVKGTSSYLDISEDYRYIGIRSASGAMYLTKVTITWLPINSKVSIDDAIQNGSISVSGATNLNAVAAGTELTLSNTPATGYKLAAYDVYKTDDATTKVTVTDGKFIMPEFDVTISATFEVAKTLKSIEITNAATQTIFWQTETFNHNGLKVTAHFDGADDEDVTNKVTVTGSTATAGEQTVTVSFTEGTVIETTTYKITVKAIPNTKETAYTVADAYDIIDKLTTANGVFIKGIVSKVDSYNETDKFITYWISDDGTTTKQLQAYKGKGLEGADFVDLNGVSVEDQVIVCGNLKKYGSTYEFDKNNYLASHTKTTKADPELSYTTTEYNVNLGDAFTTPTLNNPHSLEVTYSSNKEDVATVAADGAVTIKAAGTVTITASFAGDETYLAGNASYTIIVTDPSVSSVTFNATQDKGNSSKGEGEITKSPITFACSDGILGNGTEYRIYQNANITFAAENGYAITKVVLTSTASGNSQYGPDLLSTKEGTYTYSGKEGTWVGEAYTVTLTASAQTRATLITVYYKQDNRVDAGIAWSEATVSLTVGDAFTAPTFSNPNSLAVSFESSNTELATVDNAGVISLVNGKTGTATITATYAGNETYKPAEVTCVITVSPQSKTVVILAEYNGQWYALKNAEETAGKVLAALPVNYFGGKLYKVEDADKATIEWQLAIDGTIATFKNGENYISGTAGGADLKLATTECNWTYDGSSYMLGERTFLYRAQVKGFKNYNASANAGTADYSSLPVVTAPVYATGDPIYTRTVTNGNYGTICIPYASSSYSGAEFYEVSWLQKSGETPANLYLDQLDADAQLEAGKPYIFRATSTEIQVTCTGNAVATPVEGVNGLTGTFEAIPAGGLTDMLVIAQNKFWTATAEATAPANRAYINPSLVPTSEPDKLPGRRRVALGAAGENEATGMDNITTTDTPVKVIENGQLIIIRDGVKYNVQGVRL